MRDTDRGFHFIRDWWWGFHDSFGCFCFSMVTSYLGVSKNRGKTPQIIHLFVGFSIIFTIHFGVAVFLGNIHIFDIVEI